LAIFIRYTSVQWNAAVPTPLSPGLSSQKKRREGANGAQLVDTDPTSHAAARWLDEQQAHHTACVGLVAAACYRADDRARADARAGWAIVNAVA
jgi:hypothetical protein